MFISSFFPGFHKTVTLSFSSVEANLKNNIKQYNCIQSDFFYEKIIQIIC